MDGRDTHWCRGVGEGSHTNIFLSLPHVTTGVSQKVRSSSSSGAKGRGTPGPTHSDPEDREVRGGEGLSDYVEHPTWDLGSTWDHPGSADSSPEPVTRRPEPQEGRRGPGSPRNTESGGRPVSAFGVEIVGSRVSTAPALRDGSSGPSQVDSGDVPCGPRTQTPVTVFPEGRRARLTLDPLGLSHHKPSALLRGDG